MTPNTFKFPTSKAAWAFMRACHEAKLMAGYPSLDDDNAVQVAAEHFEKARPLAAAHGGE